MTRFPEASAEMMVRRAIREDVDDILTLVHDCVDSMRGQGIEQWDHLYPDRMTIEADVLECEAFVATVGTDLLGYVALDSAQDPEYAEVSWELLAGPTVVIHRLMISPRFQRRGHAKELMRLAEEHALNSGFRTVRLDAFLGNPAALHLYQRLGYREAGTIRHRTGEFRCFEKELAAAG